MNPGTKIHHYLVENQYSNLEGQNQSHQIHFGPIFRTKIMLKFVNLTKKLFLCPIKTFFYVKL